MESYLTVTAHFIKNRKLYIVVLKTTQVEGSHTGQNLTSIMKQIITEFNMTDKISYTYNN